MVIVRMVKKAFKRFIYGVFQFNLLMPEKIDNQGVKRVKIIGIAGLITLILLVITKIYNLVAGIVFNLGSGYIPVAMIYLSLVSIIFILFGIFSFYFLFRIKRKGLVMIGIFSILIILEFIFEKIMSLLVSRYASTSSFEKVISVIHSPFDYLSAISGFPYFRYVSTLFWAAILFYIWKRCWSIF